MKESALSLANYFVQKSLDNQIDLKPLKLMKLVYIAHGFMLAIANRSVLNKTFDKVEAWKLGPVIPSVYHSFKIFKNSPIKKQTVIAKFINNNAEFETPQLHDEIAKRVCDVVWKRYEQCSDSELVTILHNPGTPWSICYKEHKNNPIPDELTKFYYKNLLNDLLDKKRDGE